MPEFTATEKRIIQEALRRYRTAKSAEGKLAYHKALPKRPLTDDCTEANTIKARYDELIRQIESLEARICS